MADLAARRDLAIEYRALDSLVAYARNARTHSDAQIAEIAGSIREFGFTNPVLVAGDGTLIAGHGRVMAARRLGLAEVPAIVLTGLTETQRRALVLADNRIALNAGWDRSLLALEIADLEAAGLDLGLTGFTGDEIADLRGVAAGAEGNDEGDEDDAADEIPEPVTDPAVRPGDLWQLGPHRLLCGDSTDPAHVARVMRGDQAALCFTSPPYASQRDYTTGGIGDWDALMRGVFAALPMADDGQVLVNLGLVHRKGEWQAYWSDWIEWMRGAGWKRFGWYVWDQGPGLPGDWNGRLGPSFEFVFHFCRQARRPHKTVPCKYAGEELHLRADGTSSGLRNREGRVGNWTHAHRPTQEFRIPDNVIRITRHKARGVETGHPAVFPVKLPAFAMAAYADGGAICFEPFSGSGTTLLAGQQTGRIVRAIELAPAYVDVTLRRWSRLHPGIAPVLEGDGRAYAEIAGERQRSAA